ncbi:MAG: hypothetical protein KKD44_05130 [Proteobacteria bacterium]|nr:hypothetical protein [Pseudomonadota bacterium]
MKNVCCVMMVCLWMMAGCSALDSKATSKGKKSPLGQVKQEVPPPPVYSDFMDVLIPGELTEDKRQSSVTQQGDSAMGFMSYYGRVEERSVIYFFTVKMPENGWKAVTMQKSPFSTIMIFSKGKRWCTINIKEKGFNTEVQIGVAPEIEKE